MSNSAEIGEIDYIRRREKRNPIMNAPRKKGNRNFWKETRLLKFCPKCGMVRKVVQTVDEKKDVMGRWYGEIRHYCKVCSKYLNSEKMLLYGDKNGNRRRV